jgi:uncharacterized protein (DUF1778 family)
MSEAKSARINLRLNAESLATIKAAAHVQQQDLTSFVLGTVMERARAVLTEDRLLRLTPHEVSQLEQALDSEPRVIPQLEALIRRVSERGASPADSGPEATVDTASPSGMR